MTLCRAYIGAVFPLSVVDGRATFMRELEAVRQCLERTVVHFVGVELFGHHIDSIL